MDGLTIPRRNVGATEALNVTRPVVLMIAGGDGDRDFSPGPGRGASAAAGAVDWPRRRAHRHIRPGEACRCSSGRWKTTARPMGLRSRAMWLLSLHCRRPGHVPGNYAHRAEVFISLHGQGWGGGVEICHWVIAAAACC